MLRNIVIPLIGLQLSLLSPSAHGAWTSAGGKIFKYANNPWFMSNTEEVTYCLDIDEENFGVTRAQASNAIFETLKMWKKFFRMNPAFLRIRNFELEVEGTTGHLAIQKFTQVGCSAGDPVDVRFQFGTLRKDQQEKFPSHRQFVAAAMMTDYNLTKVRARGFIYIAPTQGVFKPDVDRMAGDVWSKNNGENLKIVLTHELGHLFGLTHSSPLKIMRADIPEKIVHYSSLSGGSSRKKSKLTFKYLSPFKYLVLSEKDSQRECTLRSGVLERCVKASIRRGWIYITGESGDRVATISLHRGKLNVLYRSTKLVNATIPKEADSESLEKISPDLTSDNPATFDRVILFEMFNDSVILSGAKMEMSSQEDIPVEIVFTRHHLLISGHRQGRPFSRMFRVF